VDILAYTLENWGKNPLTAYKVAVDKALGAISHNPYAGREAYKAGLRVFPVERHRIFYRIEGGAIYIIRVLHGRMDIFRHLDK